MKSILNILFVLCLASPAFAARKKKKAPVVVVPVEETYTIPAAKTEMKIADIPMPKKATHEFEVTASTWTPKDFNHQSYLADTGSFERSNLPALSINSILKATELNDNQDISAKFGLTYLSLERFANSGIGGGAAHELVNLFSARLGAEFADHHILSHGFEPAIGLYLLPTWIVGARTELDKGINAIGFPIEMSLDLLYRFNHGSQFIGNSGFVIGAGIHQIYGKVEDADLTGLGVQGIFRLTM